MSTPDPSTREGEMTNDELDRQIVDRLFPPGDLRVYIDIDASPRRTSVRVNGQAFHLTKKVKNSKDRP